MLVVLGIIAFLTAAIVVIMPRLGNASKIAATQATIKKVDELLNDRINGFNRWINTQNTLAGNNPPSYVVSSPYVSLQYQQNPLLYQNPRDQICVSHQLSADLFAEAEDPPTLQPVVHNPVTESAACLYMILTQAAVFDTEPPAAADLKGVEVADTDGDGLMEIVDAWGQPLRFYRWPTRLFRPAPSSAVTHRSWHQRIGTDLVQLLLRLRRAFWSVRCPACPSLQWTQVHQLRGRDDHPASNGCQDSVAAT